MERTIDELKEALSSLKVNSTGLAEPTRLYDLAGQCQFILGYCVSSMASLQADRDISMIKVLLGVIEEVISLYNDPVVKISRMENKAAGLS